MFSSSPPKVNDCDCSTKSVAEDHPISVTMKAQDIRESLPPTPEKNWWGWMYTIMRT